MRKLLAEVIIEEGVNVAVYETDDSPYTTLIAMALTLKSTVVTLHGRLTPGESWLLAKALIKASKLKDPYNE